MAEVDNVASVAEDGTVVHHVGGVAIAFLPGGSIFGPGSAAFAGVSTG